MWIWPGDPALADASLIYNLPQYRRLAGTQLMRCGSIPTISISRTISCDPSHVKFRASVLHWGNAASEEIPYLQHTFDRGGVLVSRWDQGRRADPAVSSTGKFQGNVDRCTITVTRRRVRPSSIFRQRVPTLATIVDPEDRDNGLTNLRLSFRLLPSTIMSASITGFMSVISRSDSVDVDERLHADFRIAFNEDKV